MGRLRINFLKIKLVRKKFMVIYNRNAEKLLQQSQRMAIMAARGRDSGRKEERKRKQESFYFKSISYWKEQVQAMEAKFM